MVSVSAALERMLAREERVEVLVSMRDPSHASTQGRSVRAQQITQTRQRVLARAGQAIQVSHSFRHVPAFAATLSHEGLELLQRDPDVSGIELALTGQGALAQAVPASGADVVQRVFNVTGRGVRVAVLDTGVQSDHPDLRGAVVAEHCFTSGACPPGRSNEGTSAKDDNGHGTAVAGVIASRGMVAPRGFAPDAEIVAVKVQGADNRGTSNNWLAGLDWVYDNLSTLKVDVVVMSFATEALFDSNDCEKMLGPLSKAVENLVRAGVMVIGSSGNAGSDSELPAPACNAGVLAVGASYDSAVGPQPPGGDTYAKQLGNTFAACRDEVTSATTMVCFTNSGPKLELLAPGAPIVSCALEGQAHETWGTSNAAAAVGGVVALVRECNPALSPAQLKDLLVRTATKSTATATRPSYPIVNARGAVEEACPEEAKTAAGAAGAAAGGGGSAAPVMTAAAGGGGQPSASAGVLAAAGAAAGSGGVAAVAGARATGTLTSANTALTAGAGGLPPSDAEPDAGAPKTFPVKPPMEVRGSLPAQPKGESHGCSVSSVSTVKERSGGWLLVGAYALGWAIRSRSRRRS